MEENGKLCVTQKSNLRFPKLMCNSTKVQSKSHVFVCMNFMNLDNAIVKFR
jgi:hypothetical protein